MCDFWRMRPTVGAVAGSMPRAGACSALYQARYSVTSSNTCGASGCQMPLSGSRIGSTTSASATRSLPTTPVTYVSARLRSIDSRFSGEPPSQYWKVIMNDLASLALSPGRYLSTFGSVRRSLSMPSSNDEPSCAFFCFMKSATIDLDWPRLAMVNEPTLFMRITSGIEGKITTASIWSRSGSTASTTFSASSCTKMSEPMKMLASFTSALKRS
mmetsp:Transcript_24874/g.51405  ORF Transcript_24874/g.51405 Transcript_24874/m.51405 type:complete len:214 (+) Transcript_24874:168-809(+)